MFGITLYLYINLGTINIFMMLNNPNHEHVKFSLCNESSFSVLQKKSLYFFI